MIQQRAILLAYHGCDIAVRDGILRGDLNELTPSTNEYDWLGDGIYFFLGDLQRAQAFADYVSENPGQALTRRPIVTPAVLGAYVELGLRLEMTTIAGREEYRRAVDAVQLAQANKGHEPLENNGLRRHLDRAAFNLLHELRKPADKLPPYEAVIAPFPQGDAVIDGGSFLHLSHVQMALRDHSCIKGWCLPPGQKLLSDSEFKKADQALKAAVKDGKPRVRLHN